MEGTSPRLPAEEYRPLYNGNILKYLRNGYAGNLNMDFLSYEYNRDAGGNLLNNQLIRIRDTVAASRYNTVDIDEQQADNYSYDAIGNLMSDKETSIKSIDWTVYGKIKQINRLVGDNSSYTYDAAGNRTSKTVGNLTTCYVRDAAGNTLSVYEVNGSSMQLREQNLYGSARVGVFNRKLALSSSLNLVPVTVPGIGDIYSANMYRHQRQYELSNHLGNVLVTISDKKVWNSTNNNFDTYLLTATEYYAFGMMMPGRSYNAANTRYGFNGQEMSNEIKGVGNSYTAEFWEYDPRVGRRWNTDPVVKDHESPYTTFSNNPIWFADPEGADTTKPGIAARLDELLNGGKAKNEEKIQMLQAGIKNQAEEVLKNRNLKQNAFNNMMGSELGSLEAKINSELYSKYEAAEQDHSKALTWMLGQLYRAERHDDNIKNYNNYVSTQLNVLTYGSSAMLTAASFIPSGGSSPGYFTFVGMSTKEISGGMKQWLRFGYSYSKIGSTPSIGFRWGAGGGFGKSIGSLWLRGANETLRGRRLIPGLKTWWNEPGHLHLIKMPSKSFFGKMSMEGIKTIF